MAKEVIDICSDDDEEEEEEKRKKMTMMMRSGKRRVFVEDDDDDSDDDDDDDSDDDDDDDCCILPFNPFLDDQINLSDRLFLDDPPPTDEPQDIAVVAERGQVACRDYPHSRHLCAKYPFSKTARQSHCQKCYCYVCDEPAPCGFWDKHCHASDKSKYWMIMRKEHMGK